MGATGVYVCVCLQVDTSHHWAVYLTHSLFRRQTSEARRGPSGAEGPGKDLSDGPTTEKKKKKEKKPAHKPSLGWFIGLISENGKVKLITFPPEIAAQQWQMTSCQGQTVSHPWGVRRSALSSDSLTRGAALPDAPLWMAGARRTGASPASSFFTPPQLGSHAGA